jgi:hypothetical protein
MYLPCGGYLPHGERPEPIRWNVYKIASKAVRLSKIDVADEAIEKSATELKAWPTAMTRRKDEITRDALKHQWPYHVALPAEKVRDLTNSEVIFCAAGLLSATPLTYFMRRNDSDLVVFCFAKPEDAEAFAKRFGGERLPTGSPRMTLKTNGRPERVVQHQRKRQLV